jgi:hypothetical protein
MLVTESAEKGKSGASLLVTLFLFALTKIASINPSTAEVR